VHGLREPGRRAGTIGVTGTSCLTPEQAAGLDRRITALAQRLRALDDADGGSPPRS